MVVNGTDNLKGLIENAAERHGKSVRQLASLAQGAGHKVTYTTLNHIRGGTYKSTPGAPTLRAIAYLAGVEESVAFAAAGQPVPGPPLADELPPGADNLSPKSRKAVVEMVRVLVDLESSTNAQRTPESSDTKPRLRAVAPEGDPRPGQKTSAADGVTELHGDEARAVPVPPRDKLAAHPKVETRREQLDNESSDF
ncbi:hypothetical protein [Glutamicibacter mysorens]|uniref:hypothetical protein n=1 Tax=Glutamicibacter mysorens TaxID=257984 RepID=UPI0020C636D6|nr:hypothetical protein [Glutamicibacter mysorens]UTM47083.1 hypothetical protein XH9_16340 [Glutamicibacter mysorens]